MAQPDPIRDDEAARDVIHPTRTATEGDDPFELGEQEAAVDRRRQSAVVFGEQLEAVTTAVMSA